MMFICNICSWYFLVWWVSVILLKFIHFRKIYCMYNYHDILTMIFLSMLICWVWFSLPIFIKIMFMMYSQKQGLPDWCFSTCFSFPVNLACLSFPTILCMSTTYFDFNVDFSSSHYIRSGFIYFLLIFSSWSHTREKEPCHQETRSVLDGIQYYFVSYLYILLILFNLRVSLVWCC